MLTLAIPSVHLSSPAAQPHMLLQDWYSSADSNSSVKTLGNWLKLDCFCRTCRTAKLKLFGYTFGGGGSGELAERLLPEAEQTPMAPVDMADDDAETARLTALPLVGHNVDAWKARM